MVKLWQVWVRGGKPRGQGLGQARRWFSRTAIHHDTGRLNIGCCDDFGASQDVLADEQARALDPVVGGHHRQGIINTRRPLEPNIQPRDDKGCWIIAL